MMQDYDNLHHFYSLFPKKAIRFRGSMFLSSSLCHVEYLPRPCHVKRSRDISAALAACDRRRIQEISWTSQASSTRLFWALQTHDGVNTSAISLARSV